MTRRARLDLPLLLPDVGDIRDRCVARLVRLLERREGVEAVHILAAGEIEPAEPGTEAKPADESQLCLHYDPDLLTLAQVTRLAELAGAEVTGRYAHEVIEFRDVGSEDDGQRLEERLRALPGVTAVSVNLAAQAVRVEYDRRHVQSKQIRDALADAGAKPTRADGPDESDAVAEQGGDAEQEAEAGWYARNRELAWSFIAGVFLVAGWLIERRAGPGLASIAVLAVAYVFGARDNVGHLVKDLRRGHFHFNIDLLMVVAAIGAAVLGEWVEGALLLFLFSLGHALEHYALGRARNAIKALAELAPQRATVIRDGRETVVAIAEVKPGDQVVVKPAERIPVDGDVAEGNSGVNQAPITGESVPVDKAPGDEVFAGSVNGEGALVINVRAAVGDRTLDRVIKLVSEAQTQKAPTQQFTERFERWFVPAVLVADVLLIAVPPLIGMWPLAESFYRGMALLVAASPCALALGTPAAVLAGIAQAARNGVLIKGGAHLEALGGIRSIALDKTGTITAGEPVVTDIEPLEGVTADHLLSLAAAVERRSQHPLAAAVVKAAEAQRLNIPDAGDLASVTGKGVRARVANAMIEVGRPLMFEGDGRGETPQAMTDSRTRLEAAGRTTMLVRSVPDEGAVVWLGVLGIADEPRANAAATLNKLRAVGIRRIIMLTGDNAGVGNAIGRAVGVDEVRAGLMPEDKVTAIRELAGQGPVAMVGDGVNDAPALASATVGIAMGGAGTAAALETADVALMGDDLARLPFAIGLSRATRGVIKQNVFLSLSVIAVLSFMTIAGLAGIGPAVLAHELSTLVVIGNALRLLVYKSS